MELREFYEKVGGNYDDTMARMLKEERVLKFLKMFVGNNGMDALKEAVETRNYPQISMCTYTMKGVAGNLGLTELVNSSTELCEATRNGGIPTAEFIDEKWEEIQSAYNKFAEHIEEI